MYNYPNFLVCVRSLTYNHKDFITDALSGFVRQETNFPYIVCLLDDASTDGTQDVIKSFVAEQFELDAPDLAYERETEYAYITYAQHKTNRNCYIVVHYLKYNHYQIGKKKVPYLAEWRDRVKYEALCEGDDYWTNPLKLQKQVDFLESNFDYVMCSHIVDIYNQASNKFEQWGSQTAQDYDISSLVYGSWLFDTLSVVFRKDALDLKKYNQYKFSKDLTLFYHILSKGKGYYMEDNMAIYRKHRNGAWTGATFEQHYRADFECCKSIYEIDGSQLALSLICERCFRGKGRRILFSNLKTSISALLIYTRHNGLKAGFSFFYSKFLLGRESCPWDIR